MGGEGMGSAEKITKRKELPSSTRRELVLFDGVSHYQTVHAGRMLRTRKGMAKRRDGATCSYACHTTTQDDPQTHPPSNATCDVATAAVMMRRNGGA